MKKTLLSVTAAASLLFTSLSVGAQESLVINQTAKSSVNVSSVSTYTYETVEQVSTSKATAKSGSFKMKYNTNVRTDAGTKNRIITTAKKGSDATATHQKKVGKEVWFKVKVNGKSGWVLSTLLTATKAPAKKAVAAKAAPAFASGSYKTKYNSNIRSNAGTNNRILTTAKKGTTVTTTAQKKVGNTTWFKVKANGKTGWVSGSLLTKVTATAKVTAKAAAPAKKTAAPKDTQASGSYKTIYNSNIRSNAGTNNRILTTAKKGTTVTATAQKKVGNITWFKVKANGKTGWVSGSILTKVTAKSAAPAKKKVVSKTSNSTANSNLINNAKALQGIKYRYAGTTTSGFDCSGFIQYVFKKSGQSIARDTLGQYAGTKATSNPQPGDLVFFAGTYRPGISHVGIYLGNNQFIHTSSSKGVTINNINDSYWKKHFHSIRR